MGATEQSDVVYCHNCGEQNESRSNYCYFCGEKLPHRTEETSPAVDESDESGSPLRAIAVAVGLGIAGLAVLAFVFFLGLAIGAVVGLGPLWTLGLSAVIGQIIGFGGVAFLYLRYQGYHPENIPSYLGLQALTTRDLGIVAGANIAILCLIAVLIGAIELLALAPDSAGAQPEDAAAELSLPIYFAIVGFMMFVVAPTEELLYRGVIQNRLREQFSPPLAIGLASIVFVFAHVQILAVGRSTSLMAIGFLALLIPAVVFGVIYERTENLLLPMLIHGIHNTMIVSLLYFAPGKATAVAF